MLKRNSMYDTTRQVVGTEEAKWASKLPNKKKHVGEFKINIIIVLLICFPTKEVCVQLVTQR